MRHFFSKRQFHPLGLSPGATDKLVTYTQPRVQSQYNNSTYNFAWNSTTTKDFAVKLFKGDTTDGYGYGYVFAFFLAVGGS